jgi:Uma2 family endonuclease
MIALGTPGQKMTLDEWADLEEDVPGELVDGELVEEEEVGALHELIVAILVRLIGNWLDDRGWVLTSDTKFAVSPNRGRKPDLCVYFTRTKLPARKVVRTPPDVAIEIVSPTPKDRRRDRLEKLREYAAFGVRYYWLVDPELRSLEVLELRDGQTYAIVLAASDGVVSVPGCDGLTLDLDALWQKLVDLEESE